jgi:hypothetical protein
MQLNVNDENLNIAFEVTLFSLSLDRFGSSAADFSAASLLVVGLIQR